MSFFRNSLMSKLLTGIACVAGLTALTAVASLPADEPTAQVTAPAPDAPGITLLFPTP